MADQAIAYLWHEAPIPADLLLTQVYGWLLCPVTGRVLLQNTTTAPGRYPVPLRSGWPQPGG